MAVDNSSAAEKILRNVTNFARLVQEAALTSLESWNEDRLENAFQWAAWCQVLAKHVEDGKNLQNGLQLKMKEISREIKPPLPCPLDMHFLKHSLDLLIEAVALNPTASDKLLKTMTEFVAARYCSVVSTPLHRLPVVLEIGRYARGAEEQLKLLEKELRSKYNAVPFPRDDVTLNTYVRHLLEKLALWLEASCNSVWFEYRLCDIVFRLSHWPHGWSVLVSCLSTNLGKVELEKRTLVRQILDLILRWIIQQHRLNGMSCPLWNVPSLVMARSAEHSVPFRNWYLKTLEEIGDRLGADTWLWGSPVSLPSTCYAYPNSTSGVITNHPEFSQLEKRFHHLLGTDTETKNQVLSLLTFKCRSTGSNIWRSLNLQLVKLLGGTDESVASDLFLIDPGNRSFGKQ